MWRSWPARCSGWTVWCRPSLTSRDRWSCTCAERDLRSVVAGVVELTGAEMEENGVYLLIDIPPEPVMVRVDAELMRQALLNLILNGMQAMPNGGRCGCQCGASIILRF